MADNTAVDSIKRRLDISVNRHGSKFVAVAGHYECAGNPVDRETQERHTCAALKTVKSWGYNVGLVGLWVDENWKVHEIKPDSTR